MPDINALITYAKFQADVEELAKWIEYECADYLLAPPKGIYVATKVNPVMVDGGKYFLVNEKPDGIIVRTPVTDITNINEGVYTSVDGVDKIVIPSVFMRNKKKYLSNEPIMACRGVRMVQSLVDEQINSFIKYRACGVDRVTSICKHLIPMELEDQDKVLGLINNAYAELQNDIYEFLDNKDWHMYFVRFRETTLSIEMSIDYRAYQWMQAQEEIKDEKKQNNLFAFTE